MWQKPLLTVSIISSFCFLYVQYESDELEKGVYQDYDSDSDVPDELKQDYVDEQTGDVPVKRSVSSIKCISFFMVFYCCFLNSRVA